jgi:hypothetical protein
MSHGVHAVQHEVEHKIQHDEHGGGGHSQDNSKDLNKKVALLISVLALFLAFSETMGKSAQTAALNSQIEASNLWNFFQAKNIRRTSTIIAAEQTKLSAATATDPAQKAAIEKQVDEWSKTAARYRSEPEAAGGKGEGTVELSAAPSKSSTIATNISRNTTTTSLRRPRSRSASCWRQPPSSPAWWC